MPVTQITAIQVNKTQVLGFARNLAKATDEKRFVNRKDLAVYRVR